MSENKAPTTITIDGVQFVRADSVPPKPDGEIKIVVLDRGFVYVGRVTIENPEDLDAMVVMRDAKNIRIWGTTKGLGELTNGPTAKTVLDDCGTVRAPWRAVISLLDTKAGSWKLG